MSEKYLANIIEIFIIYFWVIISPGPDVINTMKNSILYSRKHGICGALGIVTGVSIHLTYTIIGIGFVINQYPSTLLYVQIIGASYLCYIGYKSMRSNEAIINLDNTYKSLEAKVSLFSVYKTSLIVSTFNPIVIVLFISILSNYLIMDISNIEKFTYSAIILGIAVTWFISVAIFFSNAKVRKQFLKMGKWFTKIAGGMLLGFGIKLALYAAKIF